jgi:hypothetical protein
MVKIHEDKIETGRSHALLASDVRRILETVPSDWIEGLTEVRLANSLKYYPPYAFFSRYDGCLTIYSRRGTVNQALVAVLSAFAMGPLGINSRLARRLAAVDRHRVSRLIHPLVEKLKPELSSPPTLNPQGSQGYVRWHPAPFPDDAP